MHRNNKETKGGKEVNPGLCSSRAQWPLAPNICPRATRKSQIFHTNHMLGTLDFTVSEYWAPFNFPQSPALESRSQTNPYCQHPNFVNLLLATRELRTFIFGTDFQWSDKSSPKNMLSLACPPHSTNDLQTLGMSALHLESI